MSDNFNFHQKEGFTPRCDSCGKDIKLPLLCNKCNNKCVVCDKQIEHQFCEKCSPSSIKNLELKELINEKNLLDNEIVHKEFNMKYGKFQEGHMIIKRTPLHKNKYCIGVTKNSFNFCCNNEVKIIIAIMNSKKCDEHIFYLFDPSKDIQFLSGYSMDTQYIDFCKTFDNGKKIKLKTMEEYLDGISRSKETNNT